MHRLTVTVPEPVVKKVQHMALDKNVTLSEIVSAHLEQIAASETLPDVPKRRQPQSADAPKEEG